IPKESLLEYLLTLLNSNFEDWRRANPKADIFSFPFNLKKMSSSGCLFDLVKLTDVSKNVISVMNADTVLERVLEWSEKYDKELYKALSSDKEYAKGIFSIDRDTPKPRKDISKWSEVKDYISYFFDDMFVSDFELPENIQKEDAKKILEAYCASYDENADKDKWFSDIKALCEPLGFTPNVKEYKKNPDMFKGHVGDVSTVIRLAVTGRKNTPDLYSIMQLLGRDRVLNRLSAAAAKI
ncbi:MAG: glutamate--tRNA ligase, partial [Acutalibacteraceae bacterium]